MKRARFGVEQAGNPAPAQSPKRLSRGNVDGPFPYFLIAPSIVFMILITIIPALYVFNLSTLNLNYSRYYENGFVGLNNFARLFTEDKRFFESLGTTVKWVVSTVSLQLTFGLILSIALNHNFRARNVVRAITFLPWAVSGVLTATLFSLIFNQHVGILNDLLIRMGLLKEGVAWVANGRTVFGAVVTAETWRGIPFFAITILASLQSVPGDQYEACEIDGGGLLKKFYHVTLPHLKDTLMLTTLLRCIWEFNNVDMIFTLTGGGPYFLTSTLSIYMVNTSLVGGNYGYGSAIAVTEFFFLAAFAIIYMKLGGFGGEKNA